ncbi:MAG: YraN family protein [Pyrinomonadaceae bacterium]
MSPQPENSFKASTLKFGRFGEDMAVTHLKKRGYRVICRNFTAPIGRNQKGRIVRGEIDIVALSEDGYVCFVEVKTRKISGNDPLEAVIGQKRKRISKTADVFCRQFGIEKSKMRFDAIGVTQVSTGAPTIVHEIGYWRADR